MKGKTGESKKRHELKNTFRQCASFEEYQLLFKRNYGSISR